jgi:TolB-like protein
LDSISETHVRAHIERICDTAPFRAAPTLTRVLRYLTDKTFEAGNTPIGQRLVAEQALDLTTEAQASSTVAARMQIGRLRRLLGGFYAGHGRDEPVRIEIPKRNYRLQIHRFDAARGDSSPLAAERSPLAVVEFANLGLPTALAWLPAALTRDLIVVLARFQGLAITGPFQAGPASAQAADVNGFLLQGDVRGDAGGVHVSLRLLEGWDGMQVWATAFGFQLPADGSLPTGGPPTLTRIADTLADETGVIACHRLQATAARPADTLAIRDALLSCWAFLMTGSASDRQRACAAADHVATRFPNSPTAAAYDAFMQVAVYLGSTDPRPRPPRHALANLDRAQSLAPSDPWVLLYQGYTLWITRDPVGLEAIYRRLDGRAGSGSFAGMLGTLLVVSGVDLGRGEALIREAVARAPEPLPLFAHALAISRFRQGDLAGMGAALSLSAARTDPLPIVLRMALACRRDELAMARRLVAVAEDVLPDCTTCCDTILRRLLHDDHVDAIAAALAPLNLGWFE